MTAGRENWAIAAYDAERSKSPVSTATSAPREAKIVGTPRRSIAPSWKSSWTNEALCKSSTAAPMTTESSCDNPTRIPASSPSLARTRWPPDARCARAARPVSKGSRWVAVDSETNSTSRRSTRTRCSADEKSATDSASCVGSFITGDDKIPVERQKSNVSTGTMQTYYFADALSDSETATVQIITPKAILFTTSARL